MSDNYVETLEEIVKNIEQFNRDLKKSDSKLRGLLSMFRHWYCINKNGKKMFAPNKFIIFKDQNENKYRKNLWNLYGNRSLPILSKYFEKTNDKTLLDGLIEFLGEYGKKVNRLTKTLNDPKGGIYVLKKDYEQRLDKLCGH